MTVFLFEMSAMYALIVLFFRLGYQLIFLIGLAGNFQSKVLFEKKESEVWPARAQALARAHPRIHKRTLCGCSYWESSRVELLAIQQSVKIFALSMLDTPPARAPARANHNHFFFDSAMAGGLFHFEGGAELISPERADSDSAASPTLAMETLPSQGRA